MFNDNQSLISADPCEDCISRQELVRKLNAWDCKVNGIPNYAWKVIRELPPVTPQVKTGHWIKIKPHPLQMHDYECSECGHETDDNTEDYCSTCGAKMDSEVVEE